MCDTNTTGYEPETVTLQTAVIMGVKYLVGLNLPFSIHDITNWIRRECNDGKLEISECETQVGPYRFIIEHANVRSLFNEMWDRGVFGGQTPVLSRNHNGRFWEFTKLMDDNDEALKKLLDDMTKDFDDEILSGLPPAANINFTPAPPPTIVKSPPSPIWASTQDEAKRRIKLYLENCGKIPVYPTLKQIQSAIHRPRGTQVNLTCHEIKCLVDELNLSNRVADDLR